MDMKDSFEITPMTQKDLAAVCAIEKDSFPTPWTPALFLQELELSFSRHFIVSEVKTERTKEVVGYMIFWIIHDETQLQKIAVKKDLRKQGIGSILIREMIRICRLEGVAKGSLEVRPSNQAAIGLYQKFGFVVKGLRKGYYQDTREDALIMCFEVD
ncbi:MAG TPA: ribosomal protein S18-alanine N-acetyltransferase [Syntrophales bacterium]|jgi:ribosomal-protein-alanine N-acetyltransferase|nr:ribosomal protein S18-alanine N-acetyltransferase [Syntrophales bacterium]HPX54971.1 ribosomal protein S18-alanine N-acetyltransferase [Syntrophales bacterium]HQA82564.1 ribosomal protein S18-alanine N-acetyltransferase [Syntrophales bacterium]